jgi:zinc/manganese transport system substrate-binding protein
VSKWIGLLTLLLALPLRAELLIFACEPEWAALAKEIAGSEARIVSATGAAQDVHRIQPRPSLIAKARRADLLVCTGADLESAWLPQLLRRANNPGIRPGSTGYLEAASQVRLREIPASIDRAEGDLHPQGNPHIHLDPHNLPPIANEMASRLAILDPERAETYRRRADDFAARWHQALTEWERRTQPLHGVRVVVDHQQWAYLLAWLEMERVAALEPKPGLPPSPGYLAELKASLSAQPADLLLRADRHESQAAAWLLGQVSLPEAVLPYTVGTDAGGDALFGLFDQLIGGLLEAVQ